MSLVQLRNVNFGRSRGGLTGFVGYTVLDDLGIVLTPRTTAGIYEEVLGSGLYAARVTFPDDFHGSIVWDTGQAPELIQYATEQYNYEENNPKVDNIYDIEEGRWHIVGNQMIFYKTDNVTEVARFNLFDENGVPTMDAPFERRRV